MSIYANACKHVYLDILWHLHAGCKCHQHQKSRVNLGKTWKAPKSNGSSSISKWMDLNSHCNNDNNEFRNNSPIIGPSNAKRNHMDLSLIPENLPQKPSLGKLWYCERWAPDISSFINQPHELYIYIIIYLPPTLVVLTRKPTYSSFCYGAHPEVILPILTIIYVSREDAFMFQIPLAADSHVPMCLAWMPCGHFSLYPLVI